MQFNLLATVVALLTFFGISAIMALSLNLQYGLATLCIGGGEATAVILENVAS